jgi:predicted ATPase
VNVAPVIGHLLRETETVVFVVTSRTPLRIAAEQVYPVEPLRFSRDEAVDELDPGPAYRLFVDRARALAPGFTTDGDRAVMVSAICRHVDGLPLAIELAAARTPHLPLAILLSRLREGLDAFGEGMRDAPARQRTMRSAIGWSVDALGSELQELFAMLSVFRGGCAYGMAEDLFHQLRPVSGRSFLDLMSGLLDAGLVTMVPGTGNVPDRLRLLEPIRAYADEFLSGDARVQVHQGHASLFRELAIQAAPHLQDANQVSWLERLVAEQYNLDQALETLVEDGNLAWAVDILWHLWRFWWLAGLQLPAIRWLERILDLAGTTPGALDPGRQGQAQVSLGSFTWAIGNDALAVDALRRGISLAAEAGDERAQAIGLVTLALTNIREGDLDAAERQLDATLALPLIQLDHAQRAWAMAYTGVIAMLRKRYGDAQTRLQASLRDGELGDDLQAISESRFYLGLLGFRRGDLHSGMELLVAGLAAAEAVAEPVMIGYYLKALALGFDASGVTGDDLARAGDELLARRTTPWYMDHLFREAQLDIGERRSPGAGPAREVELPMSPAEAIAAARQRWAGLLAEADVHP